MNNKLFEKKLQDIIEKIIYSLPEELHNSIDYLTQGKKIRSNLMYQCADILKLSHQEILTPSAVLEILHSITLLHDDVIDDTFKRRNKKTLNKVFDNKTSIYSGDFLLFQLLSNLSIFQEPLIINKFIKKILELFNGEFYQNNNIVINKKDLINSYLNIVRKKTGALFSISFSSPAIIKNKSKEEVFFYQECGYTFGIAYQLIDDYNDLKEDFENFELEKSRITIPLYIMKKYYPEDYNIFSGKQKLTQNIKNKIKTKIQEILLKECEKLKSKGLPFFEKNAEAKKIYLFTKSKIIELFN